MPLGRNSGSIILSEDSETGYEKGLSDILKAPFFFLDHWIDERAAYSRCYYGLVIDGHGHQFEHNGTIQDHEGSQEQQ